MNLRSLHKALQIPDNRVIDICYYIKCTEIFTEDFGFIKTYGIAIEQTENNNVDYFEIPDISPDREFVNSLLEKIYQNDLLAIHLNDVVLDYIS